MPPVALVDPASLDFSNLLANREQIAQINLQRFEFQLLDAVLFADRTTRKFAGYSDIRENAWWVRGHIPGRPLLPGVVMLEMAAQLSSYVCVAALGYTGFLGFAGAEGVKFRGAVVPPCRLVMVAECIEAKPRRFKSEVQGFVNNTMVFEAQVIGMPL